MRRKDEWDASDIVEFPSARLIGAVRLDREGALKAVSGLIEQVRAGEWGTSVNVDAIVASLALAQIWLNQDSDLASKLSEAHEAMGDVVRSNVDFAWLFKPDGEPSMELISPDAFEALIELRVLADRLHRVGVVR